MRLLVLLLRDAQRAKVIYAQLTFSMCQDSDSDNSPCTLKTAAYSNP
jgi:hypothetical protein